jgi:hypothetical protein
MKVHKDHVHVAATYAQLMKMAKLARSMGLSVREFEPFDKVDPVHTEGSNHYAKKTSKRTVQAMDVSGARMAEFAQRIAQGDY